MRNHNPCRDCIDRSPECHAVCVTYREWSEKNRQRREEQQRKQVGAARATDFLVDGTIRRAQKARKRP